MQPFNSCGAFSNSNAENGIFILHWLCREAQHGPSNCPRYLQSRRTVGVPGVWMQRSRCVHHGDSPRMGRSWVRDGQRRRCNAWCTVLLAGVTSQGPPVGLHVPKLSALHFFFFFDQSRKLDFLYCLAVFYGLLFLHISTFKFSIIEPNFEILSMLLFADFFTSHLWPFFVAFVPCIRLSTYCFAAHHVRFFTLILCVETVTSCSIKMTSFWHKIMFIAIVRIVSMHV